MATYEYVCMACEHAFEERRSMTAPVETSTACPACGSERVRRRFSFAAFAGTTGAPEAAGASSGGGCACGGSCACRG